MKIRKITALDAVQFRSIRLQALQQAPEAFGMSYEEYLPKPLDEISQSISSSSGFILACEKDGRFVGIVGLQPERGIKRQHIGLIWGVYLEPESRGSGIAKALLNEVIDEARRMKTISILQLAVGGTNPRAQRFYEKLGFTAWGTEKRALNVNGTFIDEIHMSLDI